MDKVMITNMIGTSALGIYATGAKLAGVSQLVYSGFAGGYNYFKFKTMTDAISKFTFFRLPIQVF